MNRAAFGRLEDEFERAYRRFANTAVRVGGRNAPQGHVAMARIWRKMRDTLEGSDMFFKIARNQSPAADSAPELVPPSCPQPVESEAVRDESKSAVDLSSSGTPQDFVAVKIV